MTYSSFPDEIPWTEDAKTKYKNIPFYARSQARQSIEELARKEEVEEITAELVVRAQQKFGK
ncbi:MAG: PCP reductase family protein [Limnothrix sp.]